MRRRDVEGTLRVLTSSGWSSENKKQKNSMKFEGTIASVCDYLEITPVFNDEIKQLLGRFKVTGIECDSRRVTKGTIFYARKGAHYDPFAHLEEIKAKGAVAVLIDAPEHPQAEEVVSEAAPVENKNEFALQEPGAGALLDARYSSSSEALSSTSFHVLDGGVGPDGSNRKRCAGFQVISSYVSNPEASVADYFATDNTPEAIALSDAMMVRLVLPRHKSLGALASFIFNEPSHDLRVIGVTGTNGKSTIAYLVAQMLNACGHKCALFGTLGYGFLGHLEHSSNTTLDAITLQRELRHYADLGADYAVMEVSSIGFCEGRVEGVRFCAGGFSNLSRDHLDYHGSMDDYFTSKLNFLRSIDPRKLAINCQNEAGRRIAEALPNCFQVTLEKNKSNTNIAHALNIKRIAYQRDCLNLVVSNGERSNLRAELKLLGAFNAENYAVALGIMLVMGYDYKFLLRFTPKLLPLRGRMECFTAEGKPRMVVDYAHTPDGVEQALKAVQSHNSDGGRIFVVLGCGGDRDRGKRPLMACKASVYADYAIFTADNPRSEPLSDILEDMLQAVEIVPEGKERAEEQATMAVVPANPAAANAAASAAGANAANAAGKNGAGEGPVLSAAQKAEQEAAWQAKKQQVVAYCKEQGGTLAWALGAGAAQDSTGAWLNLVDLELGTKNKKPATILRCDYPSEAAFEQARRSQDPDLKQKAPSGAYARQHAVALGLPCGLPSLDANRRNVLLISDRYQAIRFAFEHASKQDCVLIAGKGHEDYQILGEHTIHFSDREICAELLGITLPEQSAEEANSKSADDQDAASANTPSAVIIEE